MFGSRRRRKQQEDDAEVFARRLGEVRADMDEHPPTIIDLRDLDTHLRVHIGTDGSLRPDRKPRS